MKSKYLTTASIIEVQADSDLVPIFPAGTFYGYDGRGPYSLQNPDAVIAASKRLTVDLVIDRDHAADLAPKGSPVPAAGWIKELVSRDGQILARVEWTKRAKQELEDKEYRYISPTFQHDKEGNVTRILRATLTNTPNFEMKAVASAEAETNLEEENDTMNKHLLALASALALVAANFKSDDELAAAVEKRMKELTSESAALASMRTEVKAKLNLDEKADDATIISTAAAIVANKDKADPEKFVPMAMFDETKAALASMQADRAKEKAGAAVDEAIKAGKIPPAQKDWAMDYASQNPEGFKKYVETAPVIVTAGEGKKGIVATGKDGLDDEDKTVCSMLGLSEEDYKKTAAATAA